MTPWLSISFSKTKILIFFEVVVFIALLTRITISEAYAGGGAFSFLTKFQSLKIKNELKITRTRHLDGFEQPFSECLQRFYQDTLGVRSYELEDHKKINRIGISEYIFKDTVAASEAFHLAYVYAESVRKCHVRDFNKRCFTMPLPQVYYASRDGAHVYIYTVLYNFSYRSVDASVDDMIRIDKRILLDDIYKEMNEFKS